jgi:hypothetical protein
MSSEVRKQVGEAFGRGDIQTVCNGRPHHAGQVVLWRGDAVIPAASAPGEELGSLIHHRVFACFPEIAGYRKSLETES